jgi:hypothetical protein
MRSRPKPTYSSHLSLNGNKPSGCEPYHAQIYPETEKDPEANRIFYLCKINEDYFRLYKKLLLSSFSTTDKSELRISSTFFEDSSTDSNKRPAGTILH